ncbi:hypothetical protein [Aestuariispira insulae]|uniref:Uncharacterized protein n=1 Tax=Aestuariispira insulae TaxID=1461337 RepID=A0A3D9HWA5_9PROT|nr:hypothetical protein [Aestuariispira insulae]RED53782.1 hypothetical protein DFP90_101581 [Aestuariispira insulae]
MRRSIQQAVGERYARLLDSIGFTAEDVESLWGIKAKTTRQIMEGDLSLLEMAPTLLRITDVSGCGRNYFSEDLEFYEPHQANDREEEAEIISLDEFRKLQPSDSGSRD